MLNNIFTKSIPKKKFEDFVHLDIFAKKKFEANGFKEHVGKIQSNIDFLGNHIKKSTMSRDLMFTNYLSPRTPVEITARISELFDDPTIINNVRAGNVDLNEKILNCIKLYHDEIDENEVVFKSQLADAFGNQSGVRVYAIVEVDKEELKAIYNIVLIDPFHLVIPSQHDGRSKEQMERETFNNNHQNRMCMSELSLF
jgi:hypothetical protein